MTGSDRLPSNTETQLRAPYVAPRGNGAAGRVDARIAADVLVPFVPREFRVAAIREVTVVPAAEPLTRSSTGTSEQLFHEPVDKSPSSADEPLDTTFSTIAESESVVSQSMTDLPWIDAFTSAESETEDAWPMGEAGKRLDELTQSLTSLDASRARQQVESENTPAAPEAEHEMWSEEEWIDIMPTPLALSSSTEVLEDISKFESAPNEDFLLSSAPLPLGAESAARALEGLAQRVRAGQVPVPAFSAQMAEEAMLAGLLASMLGWRQ